MRIESKLVNTKKKKNSVNHKVREGQKNLQDKQKAMIKMAIVSPSLAVITLND